MEDIKNFFKLSYPFDSTSFKQKLGAYYSTRFNVVDAEYQTGYSGVTLRNIKPTSFNSVCKTNEYTAKKTFERAKTISVGGNFSIVFNVRGRPGGYPAYELEVGDTVYASKEAVMEMILRDTVTLTAMRCEGFGIFTQFPSKEIVVVSKSNGYFGVFEIKLDKFTPSRLNEIIG